MLHKLQQLPKKIEIQWSYPRILTSTIDTSESYEWGVYQITSKDSDSDSLLYVGSAWNAFNDRIKKHNKNWIHLYDGVKHIRFGHFLTKISRNELLNIESAIIFHTEPIHNTQSILSYNSDIDYNIYNTGFRGKIPSIIKTKEH